MKKSVDRKKVINMLTKVYDDLKLRERNTREDSEQTGSGFPIEHYIEEKGVSLGFQWSAQEIRFLIENLENE